MPTQSAFDRLAQLFQSYGLPSAPDILDAIRAAVEAGEGERPELVQARLESTNSWKQRFRGNELRRQKGMNVLSVAEYLQQEDQYRQVLRNAGLPSGFYDQQDDFVSFLANDVSVGELQDRVNLAGDIANREDPSIVQALAAYGMDKGMLLAYTLDPERAAPLVKRQQNAILTKAAASRAGLNASVSQVDRLAEQGIGESQAIQGFGQINQFMDSTTKQGEIYGEQYSLDDALGEVFEGGAGTKRKRLSATERSAFSGSDGIGVQRRDTSGSY